jgi:signal peptidase I
MTDVAPPAGRGRPRSRAVAAILSLIAPGAGHVYAGRPRRGLLVFIVLVALQFALPFGSYAVPPRFLAVMIAANVVALLTIAIYVFGMIDAARSVRYGGRGRWIAVLGTVVGVWVVSIALSGVVRAALSYLPWRTFTVPSSSMVPTLRVSEWFLADTRYYGSHAPTRGDVALYRVSQMAGTIFVKRIVGLAGDTVEFRGGRAVVNGAMLDEPYIQAGDPHFIYNNTAPVTVPAGQVFVVGDNRANSMDSRVQQHGMVPVANLIGRGTEIFWADDVGRMGLWIGSPK